MGVWQLAVFSDEPDIRHLLCGRLWHSAVGGCGRLHEHQARQHCGNQPPRNHHGQCCHLSIPLLLFCHPKGGYFDLRESLKYAINIHMFCMFVITRSNMCSRRSLCSLRRQTSNCIGQTVSFALVADNTCYQFTHCTSTHCVAL